MTDTWLTIDKASGFYEDEEHVIFSGALSGEACRVHIDYEVWRMLLTHFKIDTHGAATDLPEDCFTAIERICALMIERRGIPQYGVLRVSLD